MRACLKPLLAGAPLLKNFVDGPSPQDCFSSSSDQDASLRTQAKCLPPIETKQLFESLNKLFDYVVIDLSPLAPVVDVRAITHLVDGFVFVVEWGRTKIDVVEHALHGARGVYENLLGVILNKARFPDFGKI